MSTPPAKAAPLTADQQASTRAFALPAALPALLLMATYVALTLAFTDFRDVFEFNPDEGNNLAKALVVAHQHGSFRGVWSDQPPLFTYALLGYFRLRGWTAGAARELVLLCSAGLLFATYESVRKLTQVRVGTAAAHSGGLFGVGMLLLSSHFAELRVSVLIGQPAIALFALSLWAAFSAGSDANDRRSRTRWQAAAGALLALSLATKLFTLLAAPAVWLACVAPELSRLDRQTPRRLLRPTAVLVGTCAPVLLLALSPTWLNGAVAELYRPHLAVENEYRTGLHVSNFLSADAPLYVMAALGALLGLRTRQRGALPWALWLLTATAILNEHDPLWPHHNQLMTVPAAGLSGLLAATLLGRVPQAFRSFTAAVACLAALSIAPQVAPERIEQLSRPPRRDSSRDRAALHAIREASIDDGPMVTARQIYAFYLRRPIPPQLAVTSLKRLRADELDEEQVVHAIETTKPALVLLSRRWSRAMRRHIVLAIRPKYRRLYSDWRASELEIYARR